jgi:hypothetical protein
MKEKMGPTKKAVAKIKVSQATIDNIKKMGMTKALAGASKANPEMKEALTRMYGARRVSAAANATAPKATPRGAKVDMGKAAPKMPDRGPASRMGMTAKKAAVKPAAKKSGTTDPFARAVFGAGRAVGNVLSGKEAADRVKKAKAAAAAAKNK